MKDTHYEPKSSPLDSFTSGGLDEAKSSTNGNGLPLVPANTDETGDADEPPIRPSTFSSTEPILVERRPYDISPEDLANLLHSSLTNGLSQAETQNRLKSLGRNILKGKEGVSIWEVLWRQVSNAMTAILLGALAIAFATRDYAEGGVIAAIVLANVLIGFCQEYRAERTMSALRDLSEPTANVIRHGRDFGPTLIEIPTSEVTQGDIVELRAGRVVPADLRLFESVNLELDESLLTGESLPVLKDISLQRRTLDGTDIPLGDSLNLAYFSTHVTKGRGRGIVYATGMRTEVGKIAQALATQKKREDLPAKELGIHKCKRIVKQTFGLEGTSPLNLKLTKLAHFLFMTALVLVLVVFATTGFHPTTNTALYAISLSLAIIPESLVAVVTITMARAVSEMAKRRAVVRRMDALESLGGVTHICTDKTGTLTTGHMVVGRVWKSLGREWEVVGSGRDLEKLRVSKVGDDKDDDRSDLEDLITCGSLCNDATVNMNDYGWEAQGEPTEIAFQLFAAKSSFLKAELVTTSSLDVDEKKYLYIAEHPFDSIIKRMTIVYKDLFTSKFVAFTKGAPERVLDCCVGFSTDHKAERDAILTVVDRFAGEGLRVLALAARELEPGENHKRSAVETDLQLLGLVGIYDPPRSSSLGAVRDCQRAGIIVHMLTGDHIVTARAVAREVGILSPDTESIDNVWLASDFDSLSPDDIDKLPQLPLVIARCTPHTKTSIIHALRRRGQLSAMTGDGVNDSPSLKAADVGIAMGGKGGSDVARQAAEIVLTDDKFGTIVGAVEEGRRVFDNLCKFVGHLMGSNVAEVVVLVVGLAFVDRNGHAVYPLSPVQILWENLITSAFPAFALGLEPVAENAMRRPPHNIISGLFNLEIILDIILYGFIMGCAPLLSFVAVVYSPFGDGDLGTECNESYSDSCNIVYRARATVFASLTVLILVHAFEMKHSRVSIFRMNLLRNKPLLMSVVGGVLALFPTIYIPGFNTTVFKMKSIDWEWGLVVGSIVWYISMTEGWKFSKRAYFARKTRKLEAVADLTNDIETGCSFLGSDRMNGEKPMRARSRGISDTTIETHGSRTLSRETSNGSLTSVDSLA